MYYRIDYLMLKDKLSHGWNETLSMNSRTIFNALCDSPHEKVET